MTYTLAHMASLLAAVCVAGLWQGAALVLMAAALLRLLPHASAAVRHTVLTVIFALAVILPWIRLSGGTPANSSHPVSGLTAAGWIGQAIAVLWIIAALGRTAQLFIAWRHLCVVRREAQPVEIDGVAVCSAGSRRAMLCVSADVDSPTILGFRSPQLLLPEWMLPELSGEELRQIALHECEHLRRADDWVNLFLQLGFVLSPLNPALVWLNRRIGVQRELAVDAAVVAQTAQPIAYAACLTRLAEQRIRRGHLRLALAAWERRSELVHRVHTLLDDAAEWSGRRSRAAAALAVAVLLVASTAVARVPQLVRFADAPVSVASTAALAQPAATIVSASELSAARTRDLPLTQPQMVRTAFHPSAVKPARTARKHKVMVLRVATEPVTLPVLRTIAHPASQPRAVQAFAAENSTAIPADATPSAELPVRIVPAAFSMPYVAVPMPDGWLLIQL